MSEDLKIQKFTEDLTPMRALANFFDVATPVDSPDPDDLVQFGPKSSAGVHQDGTPFAGSSQNSLRNKRKLTDLEDSQQSAAKRNVVEESINLKDSDSIFDRSEFPSQLASPSVVIPRRPNLKNKRRISTTQFMQVIQSQTSQTKEVDTTDASGESSIPSVLASPDEVLSQRPEKKKNRISTSAFSKTLGRRPAQETGAGNSTADFSNQESSGIPSNLESPDYIVSQESTKSRKRVSSTGFRKVLDEPNISKNQDRIQPFEMEESSEGNANISEMESPVLITKRLVSNKSNKRVSTTSFDKVLSNEGEKETSIKNIEQQLTRGSTPTEPAGSVNIDSNLKLKQQELIEIQSTSESRGSTGSEKDDDISDTDNMPGLESSRTFTPMASSTQVMRRQPSMISTTALEDPIEEETNKTTTRKSGQFLSSQKETSANSSSSNASTSDVPSRLDSPTDYKDSRRPGPSVAKKRISTTGFVTALSQGISVRSAKESPDRPLSPVALKTKTPSPTVEPQTTKTRRTTGTPKVTEALKVTRSSSRLSSNSMPISPKRPASAPISGSDDERGHKISKVTRSSSRASSRSSQISVKSPIEESDESQSEEEKRDRSSSRASRTSFNKTSKTVSRQKSADGIESEEDKIPRSSSRMSRTSLNKTSKRVSRELTASEDLVEEEANKTTTRKSGQFLSSQKEISDNSSSSNASTSDVPSRLDSPTDYKLHRRPGPSAAKKRISTSAFVAALSQGSTQYSSERPLSPVALETKTPSPIVESQTLKNRRTSGTPNVSETLKVTRSSSRLSSKSMKISPKRSATTPISESDEENEFETSKVSHASTETIPLEESDENESKKDKNTRRSSRSSRSSLNKFSRTTPRHKSVDERESEEEVVRSLSRASSTSLSSTSRTAPYKKPDKSESEEEKVVRSSSRTSNRSSTVVKRPDSDINESEEEKVVRSSSRTSNRSSTAVKRPDSGGSKLEKERTVSPTSSQESNTKSLSASSKNSTIPISDSGSTRSKSSSLVTTPVTSVGRVPSPSGSSHNKAEVSQHSKSGLSSGNRSRKSLMFDSHSVLPSIKEASQPTDVSKAADKNLTHGNRSRKLVEPDSLVTSDIPKSDRIVLDEPQLVDEAHQVEETPSADYESSGEEDGPSAPRSTKAFSSEGSESSNKTRMSPSTRYPALVNSTIVAGGAPFSKEPLSMSPILREKDPSSRVQTLPLTPAPFNRKQTRAVSQSPMFMNVMQKAISKVAPEQELFTPASIPNKSEGARNLNTPKHISKGSSGLNPSKGKSLVLQNTKNPSLNQIAESSDTEWEDLEDVDPKEKPLAIKIAFEEIEDRSKDFVPLETRLGADPVFQAKVKSQRAKQAALKAAEDAAAAAKKKAATQKRARPTTAKKKQEDNVANVATNKGNLRFYARTKVTKEALDAVHDLVGEWFDFTIDQMEAYCNDEGKQTLESWEDCYKMLKRQGIVKNYWDYSGLCHELLTNDECAPLLPSFFPAGPSGSKREAKRQKK